MTTLNSTTVWRRVLPLMSWVWSSILKTYGLQLHQVVRVHHPEYSASSFRIVQAGTPHRDFALQHLEQDWDPTYELEQLPQLVAIPKRFNDELLNYITETSWWNINIHLHEINYPDVPMLGLLLSNRKLSLIRSVFATTTCADGKFRNGTIYRGMTLFNSKGCTRNSWSRSVSTGTRTTFRSKPFWR